MPKKTVKKAKKKTEPKKESPPKNPPAKDNSGQEEKPVFEKPEVLLEWTAPSRLFKRKGIKYFLSLGIVMLIFVLPAIYLKEIILALVVLTVGFVVFALNRYEPPNTQYQVLNVGIKINDRLFEWLEFKNFWWEEEGQNLLLNLVTYRSYPGMVSIVLPQEHQEKTEEILLKNIPYREGKRRDYLESLESFGPRLTQFLNQVTSLFRR